MRVNSFKQTKPGSDVPLDAKNTWYKHVQAGSTVVSSASFSGISQNQLHAGSWWYSIGTVSGLKTVKQGSLNAVGKIGQKAVDPNQKG